MKLATTLLVTCAGGLLTLGLVMLFSAGMTTAGGRYPVMPAAWCGIGLVAAVGAAALDYRHLKKLAWGILALSVGLLGVVLLVGEEVNGAQRWLRIPGVSWLSFQPSEIAKLALIIALACYGEKNQRWMSEIKGGLIYPGMVIGAVLCLVFLEPDWGTTVLLGSVSGIMLLVAGVRWLHLVPVGVAGLTGLALMLMNNPTRLRRVAGWLDLEASKDAAGYQTWQSILALGSGGWTGVGLGNGMQKYGYVPFHESDFIFPVIGEELGLVCTMAVILAFVAIVICGVYIARRARDEFGMLLATGLAFMIGLQAFINIAVVTNVLPNKGLPLPFISRGGSNLVVMLVSIGLIVSVARRAVKPDAATPGLTEMEETPVTST